MCVDTFMFGSCCAHRSAENSIISARPQDNPQVLYTPPSQNSQQISSKPSKPISSQFSSSKSKPNRYVPLMFYIFSSVIGALDLMILLIIFRRLFRRLNILKVDVYGYYTVLNLFSMLMFS